MSGPYNYLFKFIIVGDTSNNNFIKFKMLANHAYCYNMLIKDSENHMKQLLEWNLEQNNLM